MIRWLRWWGRIASDREWPLKRAPVRHSSGTQRVRVLFGTNQLSVLNITTNDPLASVVGTNRFRSGMAAQAGAGKAFLRDPEGAGALRHEPTERAEHHHQ